MVEDKAIELGRLLGQSPEYQAVKRANDALTGDRDTMALLQRMEQLQTDVQRFIERGETPPADVHTQLDDLLSSIQGRAVYQRAIAAQENFDKLTLRVNNWILDGIKRGAASPIITLG